MNQGLLLNPFPVSGGVGGIMKCREERTQRVLVRCGSTSVNGNKASFG